MNDDGSADDRPGENGVGAPEADRSGDATPDERGEAESDERGETASDGQGDAASDESLDAGPDESDDARGVQGPSFEAMAWWDDLERDAAATAAEYAERGWESLQVHTGDVTALDGEYGDRVGLSVLVPDDEFEAMTERLADGGVTGYDVYRTVVPGYVALLLVLEDESSETAVVVPAYYSTGDERAERLFERAVDEGELSVYLRRLSDEFVEVTLREPALLAPPGNDED